MFESGFRARVRLIIGVSLLCSSFAAAQHGTIPLAKTSTQTAAFLQRVNAGGPSYTNNGITWDADQAYQIGSWGYVGSGGTYATSDPIANTTDDALYQSERWGMTAYRFTVPTSGRYRVDLHLAEIWYNAANKRVFDVMLENTLVLDNLDLYATVGHDAALLYTFEVEVTDGVLDLNFSSTVDDPKLSALEVSTAEPDSTPPVFSAVNVSNLTSNSATISWNTNEASDAQVEYGTTAAYGLLSPLHSALVTAHSVLLAGLNANTTYHYRVHSRDAAGNLATSADFTFTTTAQSAGYVQRVNVGGSAYTANGKTWDADRAFQTGSWGYVGNSSGTYATSDPIANTTDDALYQSERWGMTAYRFTVPTSGRYRVDLHLAEIWYNAANKRVFDVMLENTLVLDNLDLYATVGHDAALLYTFEVEVTDGVLDLNFSSTVDDPKLSALEVSTAEPDSTPPVFSAVNASNLTSNSATISWNTNEASDAQVEYGTTSAYGSLSPWHSALVTAHSVLLTGLNANTTYHYRVHSRDAAGNLATSADFTFTTTAQSAGYVQRINVGGSAYTANGKTWDADRIFQTGAWGYVGNSSGTYTTSDPIANTTDDALCQTERWGMTAYRFTVPTSGRYRVDLHFAEIWYNAKNKRVFDVMLENTLALDNLDLYATVGHDAALLYTFEVEVTDGVLDLNFSSTVDDPKLSALEVSALPSSATLTITSPNGGEWRFVGEQYPLTWNTTGTIPNVKLEYSRDHGVNWSTISANAPNTGSYLWTVPSGVSNTCLIRVSDASASTTSDVSNATFFVTLSALVNFTLSPANPVLTPGPTGSWDERIRERGWFMYENGTYHVWYSGWQGNYDHTVPNLVHLGYAYSTDGVHWTKSANNPIYSQTWIEDVAVVKEGNTYYMYAEDEYTGSGLGARINLYTSQDKLNWTRYGTVLAKNGGGWESDDVGTPTVWKEGNTWYMLYEGYGPSTEGQVGLATSSNGINWTRHPNNPVLANPLGTDKDIAFDSIIKIENVYYAYGHYDTGGHVWAAAMFTSTDLLSWTQYPATLLTNNSPVIVDNGSQFFVYSWDSSTNGLGPYNLSISTHASDTAPPIISNVSASDITSNGATVSWNTNEAGDAQVEYGLTASYGNSSPLQSNLNTTHSIALTGLSANTVYHYRVHSRDAAGNLATSSDFTFTTLADLGPPLISNVTSANVTSTSVQITFTTDRNTFGYAEYDTLAHDSTRVMPLGDSITEGTGSSDDAGYRSGLYALLTSFGSRFDFVGSMQYGINIPDPDHEGHAGYRADQILTQLKSYLQQSQPEAVFLHIGTNDVSIGDPVVTVFDEITAIVDTILQHNAKTKVFLSTLIPRRDNKQSVNDNVNAQLPGVVSNRANAGYKIFLVDMAAAFLANSNWATDWMSDNVHPNDAGYDVMASAWQKSYTAAEYEESKSDGLLATTHALTLTNLTPDQTYHYRARAKDSANREAASADFTFTTLPSGATIPLHGIYEITLNAANAGQNPYTQGPAVAITFTGTSGNALGKSLTVKGFWDGGNVYRARFAPMAFGNWSWNSSSSDAGLNAKSGAFTCADSLPTSHISRKGHVRESKIFPYTFAHEDSTPFFIMGDTQWSFGTSAISWPTEFQTYVNARSAQGFNYVHGVLYQTWPAGNDANEGGQTFLANNVDNLNPGFWQAFDQRVAYMNQKGMVAGLMLAWANNGWKNFSTVAQVERFVQYVVNRYGAYNVFWITAGEYEESEPPGGHSHIGEYLDANDIYNHPTTTHPLDTSADDFGNAAWHTTIYQQLFEPSHITADRIYNKPVINSEFGYEGMQNATGVRRDAWQIMMRGGFFVYGNLTTFHSDAEMTAQNLNSVGAAYMTILKNFWTNNGSYEIEWQRFTRFQVLPNGRYLAGLPGVEYVVYVDTRGAFTIDLSDASGPINGQWLDTRTGTWSTTFSGTASAAFTLTPPDSGYVAYLHATSDVTSPVISQVTASNLTSSTAQITWTTNEPADSQVEYGLTASYGNSSPLAPQRVTAHSLSLTGLQANTLYHFRVHSKDASENLATSADFTFTTSSAGGVIFSDNFDVATLDLNKWSRGGNSGNQAALVNNALELRSQGSQSGWVMTKQAYIAQNTAVTVKVVQPNNDGDLGMTPTINLGSGNGIFDQSNWYRFYVYRNQSSGPYLLYAQWNKAGAVNGLDVTGNLVVNGVVYLRLRCDATRIYFEASLDGVNWVTAYSEPFALPGYSLSNAFYYELAGYKTSINGVLTVDDFSITGSGSAAAELAAASSLEAAPAAIPSSFALSQNYPNPFSRNSGAATRMNLALPQPGRVRAVIYNLQGQEVKRLYETAFAAGSHVLQWNGANEKGEAVSSGAYLLRVIFEGEFGKREVMTRRLTLMK